MAHLFTACAAAAALLTSLAAGATAPPAAAPSPIATSAPRLLDAADLAQWPADVTPAASKSERGASDASTQTALWMYCGYYTRADGKVGIKCYAL